MWNDINYDTHQLKIQRSIYKPKGENQVIKGTKSVSSNRTVYLSDSGLETLRLWKIEQERQKRHCKGIWNDTGFIFTNESGEAISIYAPTRICAEFEQRHDLRHLKLHGLRHTCGSLMINHGVDAETVKAVLGHESLKTTNRYLHPYESGKKKASETMEALIRGMTDDKTSIHLSGG